MGWITDRYNRTEVGLSHGRKKSERASAPLRKIEAIISIGDGNIFGSGNLILLECGHEVYSHGQNKSRCMNTFSAQQCAEKDKEIERLQSVAVMFSKTISDYEKEIHAYKNQSVKHSANNIVLQADYEVLKQKADKLSIAINAFRDYCKYHNILLGSGIIEQVQEAITNYEKQ